MNLEELGPLDRGAGPGSLTAKRTSSSGQKVRGTVSGRDVTFKVDTEKEMPTARAYAPVCGEERERRQ